MRWNFVILIVIGVWLIISPWVLGYSALNLPSWNNLLMGALVVIFSLWNISAPKGQ
ncbi:SPW repeat protein [Patescibacteria group bacterium]|nr:SPW repeat protein [Patescibacteria group bacterium]